ncbi:hypothetical protein SAMN05421748_1672, partial [Paractinoplanes atraurantiacus]
MLTRVNPPPPQDPWHSQPGPDDDGTVPGYGPPGPGGGALPGNGHPIPPYGPPVDAYGQPLGGGAPSGPPTQPYPSAPGLLPRKPPSRWKAWHKVTLGVIGVLALCL